MTRPDIEAIRKRVDAATEGPWKGVEKGNSIRSIAIETVAYDGEPPKHICSGISPKTANSCFIAHAREDMPALLSYIAELEAVADVARKRDAKIKEWRNMRYVNGLAADTRKINQELCKFDDDLHNVLAKLDGDSQ